MFINKKEFENLIAENKKLKHELHEAKMVQKNLAFEVGELYERLCKETNHLFRPKECVESGCKASCDISTYIGSKLVFKDNPNNCVFRK